MRLTRRPGRRGAGGLAWPEHRAAATGGCDELVEGVHRRRVLGAAALLAPALSACGGDAPSILDPDSEAGRRVEDLWWVVFWISAVVVVVVTAFLIVAVRRRQAGPRPGDEDGRRDVDIRPVPWGDRFVVWAGVVVPGGILAGTFVYSLGVLGDLADPPEAPALEVEVVGHTWWWEVRYPNGAVTANEIRIPAGETVELALPSADVIHSFWVPELQVKKDNIPGIDNRLWVVADRAGRFQGQCAEFCGLQHAHMKFEVSRRRPTSSRTGWTGRPNRRSSRRASRPSRKRGLRALRRAPGATPSAERRRRAPSGPDLTHLADRETIGAGLDPADAREPRRLHHRSAGRQTRGEHAADGAHAS